MKDEKEDGFLYENLMIKYGEWEITYLKRRKPDELIDYEKDEIERQNIVKEFEKLSKSNTIKISKN